MSNTLVIGTYLCTSSGLSGYIVAAIESANAQEYVAVFRREMDSNIAYSTHVLYFDSGRWMAANGRYDMTREAALASMTELTS